MELDYLRLDLGGADGLFERTHDGEVITQPKYIGTSDLELAAEWLKMKRPLLKGDTVLILRGYWTEFYASFIAQYNNEAWVDVDVFDGNKGKGRRETVIEPLNNIRYVPKPELKSPCQLRREEAAKENRHKLARH
jgi:hypothetical protein